MSEAKRSEKRSEAEPEMKRSVMELRCLLVGLVVLFYAAYDVGWVVN